MKFSKLITTCSILLLLTSSMGFTETYKAVEVTASNLNVRETMTVEAPILGSISRGSLVETSELTNGWYRISYSGQTAYISADYAQVKEAFITGNITGDDVNLRDAPSIENSTVLFQLSNTKIKVHSKQDDWYSITTLEGHSGYVFADLVSFESSEKEEAVKESAQAPIAESTIDSTDLIEIAKSKLGSPYKWSAEGPNAFDCSGFVKYCFKQAYSIDLPHSASAISKKGTRIPKDQLQAGDIVFFSTNRSGNVNHAGIYIGNGDFIHASSSSYNGHQVHINPINTGFYDEVYKWAQRLSIE